MTAQKSDKPMQFDLFMSPLEVVLNEQAQIRKSVHNVRKGTYAWLHNLEEKYIELAERLEKMEKK